MSPVHREEFGKRVGVFVATNSVQVSFIVIFDNAIVGVLLSLSICYSYIVLTASSFHPYFQCRESLAISILTKVPSSGGKRPFILQQWEIWEEAKGSLVGTRLIASAARAKQCAVLIMHLFLHESMQRCSMA